LLEGWFRSRWAGWQRLAVLPAAAGLRSPFALVAVGFLIGVFCAYATFRQRHVGACDFYGYYQQAILLQEGKVFLPTELDVSAFPSIVPLGYAILDGRAVPQYPPGLPLLIAIAGLVGLRTFLLPVLGVVSGVYMYLTCRELSDQLTAALFTLLWCVFPLVVFGSTTIMSDLAAALFVIIAYYHYRRGQLLPSALAMGFGFCVRPANVLILAPFALLLIRDRQLFKYALWLALPCAAYAVYNTFVFGLPWRTGYSGVLWFSRDGFAKQLSFYGVQTFLQLGPVVLGAALFAFRRPSLEKFVLLAWFAILTFAYSFWVSGNDRWWWARYLLPGYPALFFLGAQGFGEALQLLRGRGNRASGRGAASRTARWAALALTLALALTPIYYVRFGLEQNDLYVRNKGFGYYDLTQRVAALVPPGSYVGSTEFTGAFHLYRPEITPFVSVHQDALHLVDHALREGREAYLVVEPPNRDNTTIRQLFQLYDARKIAELPIIWSKLPVYRLLPKHAS
jgi:hypothetical protein